MAHTKKALIFKGGWDGHEPNEVSEIFKELLEAKGYEVEVYDNHECLEDVKKLRELDVIVPVWTMGEIEHKYVVNVIEAVNSGVSMIGCHGGMCDAFRNSTYWQFLTGGQWVIHPGADGVKYKVNILDVENNILEGMKDFYVTSEQYYLLVDPAVKVLATTKMPVFSGPHASNGEFDMPVTWTKKFGLGRIFYTSLGHHADIVDMPECREMINRGIDWVQDGKDLSMHHGLNEKAPTGDEICAGF